MEPDKWNGRFHHMRFVVVMMGGCCIGLMLLLRFNVTVAILNMVNQTALYLVEHPNATRAQLEALEFPLEGEYLWNNEVQQMIMSWYMFAYTLPQLPLTRLANRVGARSSMFVSLALAGAANLATPSLAAHGWQWVLAMRLINGVGVAPVLPIVLGLIERWMPGEEMALGVTLSSVIQALFQSLTPLICGYLTRLHWSYAFTVPAIGVFVFCLLWSLLVRDSPDSSSLISARELAQIRAVRERLARDKSQQTAASQQQASCTSGAPNWTHVLRTGSFWAYVAIWALYCCAFASFNFVLPTYLRQFQRVPVDQNGLICFVIQSGCLVSFLWPHPVTRALKDRLGLSTTSARRASYSICCLVVASTSLVIGLTHSHQLPLLFINRCFHTSNDVLIMGSLMDNWSHVGLSGIAFSMVNTLGNIQVVLACTALGWLLDRTGQSVFGWSLIFYLVAASQAVVLVLFFTCIHSRPIELFGARKSLALFHAPQLKPGPNNKHYNQQAAAS